MVLAGQLRSKTLQAAEVNHPNEEKSISPCPIKKSPMVKISMGIMVKIHHGNMVNIPLYPN
jgi:hypothetical protein